MGTDVELFDENHTGGWRGTSRRAILARPRFNLLSRRSRAAGRPGSQPDESIASPTGARPDVPTLHSVRRFTEAAAESNGERPDAEDHLERGSSRGNVLHGPRFLEGGELRWSPSAGNIPAGLSVQAMPEAGPKDAPPVDGDAGAKRGVQRHAVGGPPAGVVHRGAPDGARRERTAAAHQAYPR